jgi:hypothetical protein
MGFILEYETTVIRHEVSSSQNLEESVMLGRLLIGLIGVVVWTLVYLHARCAYRMPRTTKKTMYQLSLVFGAVFLVILQVNLMEHLTPQDAYGPHFFVFVLIECGGAIIILFTMLSLEKARALGRTSTKSAER